jgi:hypothetical protein
MTAGLDGKIVVWDLENHVSIGKWLEGKFHTDQIA